MVTPSTIITKALHQLVVYYITNQIPFTVRVQNTDNWKAILPSQFHKNPDIIFYFDNTDLEESYINTNGDIILTVGIDNIPYQGILDQSEILLVAEASQSYTIFKPYTTPIEQPIIEGSIAHSTQILLRNNPHLQLPKSIS